MAQDQIPGLQIAFFSKDKILFSDAIGHADLAQETPMTVEHIIRVASISKIFTAVAVAQLIERKLFSLETRLFDLPIPFVHWLRAQPLQSPGRWEKITIADLLGHTSRVSIEAGGVNMWSDMERLKTGQFPTDKEIENGLRHIEIHGEPGLGLDVGTAKYSNVGPILLARVVADYQAILTGSQSAADRRFQEYVLSNIIFKLGLKNTHYVLPSDLLESQISRSYSDVKKIPGQNGISRNLIPITQDPAGYSGPVGVASTAQDLAVFFQSILKTVSDSNPDSQLLPRSALLQMFAPRAVLTANQLFGLGFSWVRKDLNSPLFVGHGGGGTGETLFAGFSARTGLGLVIAMNARTKVLHEYFLKIYNELEQGLLAEQPRDRKDHSDSGTALEEDVRMALSHVRAQEPLKFERDDENAPTFIQPFLGTYTSAVANDIEIVWGKDGQLAIWLDAFYRLEPLNGLAGRFRMRGHPLFADELVELLCDSENRVMRMRYALSKYFNSVNWDPSVGPLVPCQINIPVTISTAGPCEDLL